MIDQYRDPDEPTGSHLRNLEETRRRLLKIQAEACEAGPFKVGAPAIHVHDIAPKPSRYLELIDEMVATHTTKNRDYADSNTDALRNFRRCEEVGIPAHMGCFVRMGDKFMRIENLLRRMQAGGDGPAVKSESVIDTLKDLAVYALIEIELIEQYLAQQGAASE